MCWISLGRIRFCGRTSALNMKLFDTCIRSLQYVKLVFLVDVLQWTDLHLFDFFNLGFLTLISKRQIGVSAALTRSLETCVLCQTFGASSNVWKRPFHSRRKSSVRFWERDCSVSVLTSKYELSFLQDYSVLPVNLYHTPISMLEEVEYSPSDAKEKGINDKMRVPIASRMPLDLTLPVLPV